MRRSCTITHSTRHSSIAKRCAATVAILGLAAIAVATDNRAPVVPTDLEAPGGTNKVHFHTYAAGVQIYRATYTTAYPPRLVWTFVAPEALLFDADNNIVGTHYAGPTWESNSGSLVVGARVSGATLSPDDIPWLLLRAVSTAGPGVFERTTFIQRVNTVGGVMPSTLPTHVDQEARVPYTTEYFFYRSE